MGYSESPGLDYLEAFAASVLRGELDFALLVAMRGNGDGNGPLDHPCPLCGPGRSTEERQLRPVLRTWRPSPDRISYYCARCETKGAAHAGDSPTTSPLPEWLPPPVKSRSEYADGRADWYAEKLWKEATTELPAKGRAYFRWRGISLEDVPEGALRFHPKCPFGTGNYVPCILARYSDAVTGKERGIWRRPPIANQNVSKPMSLGGMKGCVIRLWPQSMVGRRLVLGEGVETTLAAATRVRWGGAALQPAWAAGSAGNMRRFPVLDGIEELVLLVDNDLSGAGQAAAAAEECKRRWYNAGRTVIRLMPPQLGTDFNDWIRS
jgi:hypothetical protein